MKTGDSVESILNEWDVLKDVDLFMIHVKLLFGKDIHKDWMKNLKNCNKIIDYFNNFVLLNENSKQDQIKNVLPIIKEILKEGEKTLKDSSSSLPINIFIGLMYDSLEK